MISPGLGVRLIRPEFVDAQHGALQDHGVHLQLAYTL